MGATSSDKTSTRVGDQKQRSSVPKMNKLNIYAIKQAFERPRFSEMDSLKPTRIALVGKNKIVSVTPNLDGFTGLDLINSDTVARNSLKQSTLHDLNQDLMRFQESSQKDFY